MKSDMKSDNYFYLPELTYDNDALLELVLSLTGWADFKVHKAETNVLVYNDTDLRQHEAIVPVLSQFQQPDIFYQARIGLMHPGDIIPLHRDISRACSINMPICPGNPHDYNKSALDFYTVPDEILEIEDWDDQMVAIQQQAVGPVESVPYICPTVINPAAVHGVKNNDDVDRWILSFYVKFNSPISTHDKHFTFDMVKQLHKDNALLKYVM